MKNILLFSWISILLVTCQKPDIDSSELQEELVQKKIDNFVARKNENCYQQALDSALVLVDSALIVISRRIRREGVDFPNKPNRPNYPEVKEPLLKDLDPLFDSLPKPDDFGVGLVDSSSEVKPSAPD